MVKKVKRFLVLALFSFFWASKYADAAKVCLVPTSDDGKLKYNGGIVKSLSAYEVAQDLCGY